MEHSNKTVILILVAVVLTMVLELQTVRFAANGESASSRRMSKLLRELNSSFLQTQSSSSAVEEALNLLENRCHEVDKWRKDIRAGGNMKLPSSEARTSRVALDSLKAQARRNLESLITGFEEELKKKILEKPPAGVQYSGDGAMDAVRKQQIASQIENEYPSEAVDEMPGPHYVAPPDPWASLETSEQNERRALSVIDAFKHSWTGYTKYALGWDELQPRTQSGKNWNEMDGPQNGLGLTILDSITTMHVMGLRAELDMALSYVKTKLSFERDVEGSAFETTIRMLGALLSIYELTGETDHKLLSLAEDVANRVLWAYNTTTGIPHSTVGFASRRHFNQQWNGGSAVLSELGTVQLELRTLSFHTKNPVYDMKATHLMDIVEARAPDDFLCPCYMNIRSGQWTVDHVSLGALGDSFYEYILKQYLLTGKREKRYRKMFLKIVRGIVDKLLFRSYPSNWAYVAEYRRGEYYHKMDHLACFVGGMLALGASEVSGIHKEEMLELAGDLTETCVKMYTRQKTGVSPEMVEFPAQQDFINGAGFYILRPETMESLFYMWRLTKQQKWRDYGWSIFRAINRWCRVDSGGFSGLREVNVHAPIKDNLMQSFWMAETMKYTYLLFANDSALDLNDWVLNTEAHPLRRRQRDPLDIWREFEEKHGGPAYMSPDVFGVTPTETDLMKKVRESRHGGIIAPTDPYGEDVVDGQPDDEGNPYDPLHGKKGLPQHPGSGILSTKYIEQWALDASDERKFLAK